MADIAKVVTVIGNSPESFAARRPGRGRRRRRRRSAGSAAPTSISMSCEVDGDRITTYRTTVNIAFGVERS